MPSDFLAGVLQRSLATKRAKIAEKRGVTPRLGGPYPGYPFTPQTPHTEYVLIIHKTRCRHCGAEEMRSNRHLLAHFAAPANGVLSIVPADKVDPNLPKHIRYEIDPNGPDWCRHCFQESGNNSAGDPLNGQAGPLPENA